MRLFHFCAPQFLEGIKRDGLTLGRTPVLIGGRLALMPDTQWMTVNGSFEQSWNAMVRIKYDRTAYRLEFVIPKSERDNLATWWVFKESLIRTVGSDCIRPDFDAYGDPDNWRIFLGKVKPGWLRNVVQKPAPALMMAFDEALPCR